MSNQIESNLPEDWKSEPGYFSYEGVADTYVRLVDLKPHNVHYERPAMLKHLPNSMVGKTVLDAGCGAGWYGLQYLDRGAKVIGVDISPKMLAFARQRLGDSVELRLGNLAEPLSWIHNQSLDWIVAPLSLHYIEKWKPVMIDFFRMLKPGGTLLFSTHHPFADWQLFRKENYFERTLVEDDWGMGAPLKFYRRPLQEIIQVVLEAGFILSAFEEIQPIPGFEELDPRGYRTLLQSPLFLLIRAAKPNQ